MLKNPQFLARGIRMGSSKVFSIFYEQYKGYLFASILKFVNGNEADARDVLQQVLIKLTKAKVKWKTEEQLRSWCFITCKNSSIDFLRKHGKTPDFSGLDEDETLADPNEVFAKLEQAIDSLDSEEAKLLREVYWEKIRRVEIADREQTTVKALESKLARIRKKMKKILERREYENVR
ncbi:MAG: sigma-70 family RNA polymerase sigma factor [Opitutales bacterium]|nr:sigma-70 family RNA polymerase sigma factor [Opitutales bacterium]